MKCTRHPLDDGVGVCAPCLRERLLALDAATAPSPDDRKATTQTPSPPPLPFPRSVSPYVPRSAAGGSRRASFLSALFGRRGHGNLERRAQRSSSWLSALLHGRRRKMTSCISFADDAAEPGRDWGMSPERSRGGCDAEPPWGPWRPQPSSMMWATADHHHHHGSGLAGFAMCFSPLAAASSRRRRSRVAEFGFSGELPRTSLGSHRHRRHASAGGPVMWHDTPRKSPELGRLR
ncbi:transposon protein [Musa troglodytarum]|uniref:Transposon protein n=1 Tax=Musa troglodytarum TaxID=320322 RepID=A0A9E7F3M9_9LILI|nr:transposon protein [Musa troglodytarum]